MIDITEQQITQNWNWQLYSWPLVSIRCLAFNHEKYIASALDGFLMQKTTFPFYIFIHDDCSTDRTAMIIREYEKKFPHIVKAVYEEENVFSRHDGTLSDIIEKYTNTKYEALCEGDDYWTDEYKLQKQIDYMESHDDCTITFTNGRLYDVADGTFHPVSSLYPEDTKFYQYSHVITLQNFAEMKFPPTASYVIKKICEKGFEDVPVCPTGDLSLRLFALTKGHGYYFADDTCVYRSNVPASLMTKWRSEIGREIQHNRSSAIVNMLDYIDQISNYEYTDEIEKIRWNHAYSMIDSSTDFKFLNNQYYKAVFSNLGLLQKIRIVIKIMTPERLYCTLKRIIKQT